MLLDILKKNTSQQSELVLNIFSVSKTWNLHLPLNVGHPSIPEEEKNFFLSLHLQLISISDTYSEYWS